MLDPSQIFEVEEAEELPLVLSEEEVIFGNLNFLIYFNYCIKISRTRNLKELCRDSL
jgi:hypothetical protein